MRLGEPISVALVWPLDFVLCWVGDVRVEVGLLRLGPVRELHDSFSLDLCLAPLAISSDVVELVEAKPCGC